MLDKIKEDAVCEANANAQATCKAKGKAIFNSLKSWLSNGRKK
jgi:hypothetical protein